VLRRIFVLKEREVAGGWRKFRMRSFITCTVAKCYLCDKIKQDKMGEICSTRGRDEYLYVQNFSRKIREEETIRKS